MEVTNPYKSPTIVADSESSTLEAGLTPFLGVVAVAVGAVVGGIFGVIMAGWLDAVTLDASRLNGRQILFWPLPVGSVIGGLSAKWCLLQFVRNR